MDPDRPMTLLGGMSAALFMRRHWQKKPLVIRDALPGALAEVDRARLLALAAEDGVESRLVVRSGRRWSVRHGPIARRSLPPRGTPAWTVLVQGVDLHDDAAHRLLRRFRFIADARLDDVMCSWAADGGGVGPHVDSYDVFLLQASGRRRWRIARDFDATLDPRAPLKVLRRFVPEQELVLEAGDLLYLPPNWAHEGVALGGDCMTCSIGMRAPQRGTLAAELVQRIAETHEDAKLYGDAGQGAADSPAAIPRPLAKFADNAVRRLAQRPGALARALGEVLSEPKATVWFRKTTVAWRPSAVVLDRRTRMLYDARHVFVNGESVPARGKDAALLRRLADERTLDESAVRAASSTIRRLLAEWFAAGWLQARRPAVVRNARR